MSYNKLHVSSKTCFVVANSVPCPPLVTKMNNASSLGLQEALDALVFVSQYCPLHPSPNTLQKIGSCPLNNYFASRNTASKLHGKSVVLFLTQRRHMVGNDSTYCTSRSLEPRLHTMHKESPRRSQLHNAHKDVDVEIMAAYKCEYYNSNHITFLNLETYFLFTFRFDIYAIDYAYASFDHLITLFVI